MLSTDLLIVASVGVLILYTLYLRTNIALATLSLGAGYVLADLTTASVVSSLYRFGLNTGDWPVSTIVATVLTLLPSLIILIRFRRYQSGRFLEHLAPSVSYSLLLVLLILIQLPFDVQRVLSDESYIYSQFEYFRTFIVLAAVLIAVFDVMAHEQRLRRKSRRKKDRKVSVE
jgi:hypothetical protein